MRPMRRSLRAVCSSEQSSGPCVGRVVAMPFEYMKASIVAVWVLILAAAALSLGVASATGWLVLV